MVCIVHCTLPGSGIIQSVEYVGYGLSINCNLIPGMGTRFFSSPKHRTDCGACPTLYLVGVGSTVLGVKGPRA